MVLVRLLPVILSFLLLAAHFSRADHTILVIVTLIFPFLFFIKSRIILRIIQVVLLISGAEWVRAMLIYIEARKSMGDDWIRLALILSVVAIYTAASGLFLHNKKVLDKYKPD